MKKHQILTIFNIAVVSFLIGTMFNMNFVTSGNDGRNPFDTIWEAIDELESRVDDLERPVSRMIRFYNPDETSVEVADGDVEEVIASFTWTPEDVSNNVIIWRFVSFEYKANKTIPVGPEPWTSIYGYAHMFGDGESIVEFDMFFATSTSSETIENYYQNACVQGHTYRTDVWNCNGYEFNISLRVIAHEPLSVSIRNLNMLIGIADEIPASN